MLGHESIEVMYLQNFALIQHHGYSLKEIEEMLPYERDIYTALLNKWIQEENKRRQNLK